MSDQTTPIPPDPATGNPAPATGDPAPATGDPAPDAEAWALIDALLDGRSTPDGRRQLHDWVTTQPDVARMYARAAHLFALLPRNVRRPEHPAVLLARMSSDGPTSMDEAMILPALREADLTADEPTRPAPARLPRPVDPPSRWPSRWVVAGAALSAAAVAVVVTRTVLAPALVPPSRLAAGQPVRPPSAPVVPLPPTTRVAVAPQPAPRPAAVVTASAGAVWDRGPTVTLGTALLAGQAFELSRGGLELTTDRGAVVVVAGPARVRVLDRDRLELQTGSLAAHVPPPAVGFGVVSPGLLVIDRGTNFGVRATDGNGASEVAVFDGAVDAAASADEPAAPRVRVTAGHAATHAVGTATAPVTTGYHPAAYLRSLADLRLPVPLHGTGQGIPIGEQDPAWQVVAVPNEPDRKPAPAFVAVVDPARLAPNTPDASWISIAARMPDVPAGNYLLRTTLDLTGFDPTSAVVAANLIGDGQVTDILVNGTSTSEQNPPVGGRNPRSPPRRWTLDRVDWRPGPNEVTVVVYKVPSARGTVGPVGLHLGWSATARPVVSR
jgi:hypothetical protein